MVTSRNPLTLAAVISLWLASVGDWPLWRAMGELPELASVRGMLFIASLGLMVAGISLALLALGAWRRSIKPLAALPLVVAAIGAHFMGSYSRITNPGTAMLGLVGFSGVSSCGTNTAASLSCMFSHLGGEGFGARKQEQESLRDLLRRAGLATLWLDNQSGCKGQCERVPNAAARDAPPGTAHAPGLCRDGECLAEALLTGLDQRLAAWPEERRQRGVVLVLHQMGSHGPAYCRRSPPSAKPFLPKCTSHALQGCDRAALVNAYDNSIAYTDHVLAKSVAWLSAQAGRHDPMLLKLSDHGESLGETNLFLHGLPYALAPRGPTQVPMLMWLPPQTEAAIGVARACLQDGRDLPLSHDHLFHTVLSLVGASSSMLKPALDLATPCRNI